MFMKLSYTTKVMWLCVWGFNSQTIINVGFILLELYPSYTFTSLLLSSSGSSSSSSSSSSPSDTTVLVTMTGVQRRHSGSTSICRGRAFRRVMWFETSFSRRTRTSLSTQQEETPALKQEISCFWKEHGCVCQRLSIHTYVLACNAHTVFLCIFSGWNKIVLSLLTLKLASVFFKWVQTQHLSIWLLLKCDWILARGEHLCLKQILLLCSTALYSVIIYSHAGETMKTF